MAVTIQLPPDVEQRLNASTPQRLNASTPQRLCAETPDLDSEAKEALLVELYRQDKLSRHELSLALGLTRFETDALLKKHRVTEDLPN